MSTGQPQRVLVLGGSSEIGGAILRRLAERRPLRAVLLGRDADRTRDTANELTAARGSWVEVDHLDAEDLTSHADKITDAFVRLHGWTWSSTASGSWEPSRDSTLIPTSSYAC